MFIASIPQCIDTYISVAIIRSVLSPDRDSEDKGVFCWMFEDKIEHVFLM